MPPVISEATVRSNSSAQSYIRGQEYYRSGAIFNTSRVANTLYGECEGAGESSYHLVVNLEKEQILSADCSCPYSWGGLCKHIVALLLAYIHEPELFSQRLSVADMLAGYSREDIINLIDNLTKRDPGLYDRLETATMAAPQTNASTVVETPAIISRRVLSLIRHLDFDNTGFYYNAIDEFILRLDELVDSARKLIEDQDGQNALAILIPVLEVLAEEYNTIYDEGDLAIFINDLGVLLAEAILLTPQDEQQEHKLIERLEIIHQNLVNNDISGAGVALAAAFLGWRYDLPLASQVGDIAGFDKNGVSGRNKSTFQSTLTPENLARLNHARLRVLELQGRQQEYLDLSKQAGEMELHTRMLVTTGQIDRGFNSAMANLTDAFSVYTIAKMFYERGHVQQAMDLGHYGLSLSGRKDKLGSWLGDAEMAHEHYGQALNAYNAAFSEAPSLELYKSIKSLTDQQGEQILPRILDQLASNKQLGVLIDIYLYESDWDRAIQCTDQLIDSDYRLIEKVVDAVSEHRPDWAIQACQDQVESLVVKRQSRLYPIVTYWLVKMKQIYSQHIRQMEWENYIAEFRRQYSRRPALIQQVKEL